MDDLIREMLEPERPAPGVVARRRRLTATVAIIGLAAIGVANLTTSALFTDEADTNRGNLVTGTVDISADELALSADFKNAAPGDTYYTPIVVSNEGTLQLRYSMTLQAEAVADGQTGAQAKPALLDELRYDLHTVANANSCGPTTITGGTSIATESEPGRWLGSQVHNALGDATPGSHSGDRVLPAGASETLCLEIYFDKDATSAVANAGARVNLTFSAEQTANNP